MAGMKATVPSAKVNNVERGAGYPPNLQTFIAFISSDRSSYSDAVLLDTTVLHSQIFTQSIDAIDVTSVNLSCLNSINAIDVKRC